MPRGGRGRREWWTTEHPRNKSAAVGPFAAISAVANSLGMSTREEGKEGGERSGPSSSIGGGGGGGGGWTRRKLARAPNDEGRTELESAASVSFLGRPRPNDSPYFGFRYDMAEGMKEPRRRNEGRDRGGKFYNSTTDGRRDARRKKVCDKK